jgi:hypothetical protein
MKPVPTVEPNDGHTIPESNRSSAPRAFELTAGR